MLFGVTRADGRSKPAAAELERFARLVGRLDLKEYALPEPEAYLVVPSHNSAWRYPFWSPDTSATQGVLLEAWVLSKQAHLPIGMLRERGLVEGEAEDDGDTLPLPGTARLLILPHCQALLASSYQRLLEFARVGGVVYHSYHVDPSIDLFEELFGCAHGLRYGLAERTEDEIDITFLTNVGAIHEGEKLSYRRAGQTRRSSYCPVTPLTAEVVATDSAGRPALLVNRVGRGAVVFSAYPLEYYLWSGDDVHVTDQTHRLYAALGQLAGIRPPFQVDNPQVEVGWFEGSHDYFVWLINHDWEAQPVNLEAAGRDLTDAETGTRADTRMLLPAKGVRVLSAKLAPSEMEASRAAKPEE